MMFLRQFRWYSISASAGGPGIARGCAATSLAEHRGKPIEHLDPAASHPTGQFWPRLVGQVELAPTPERLQHHGHPLELQGIFLRKQREHQPARPHKLEIFADMIYILAVSSLHDVKPASDAPVDLDAYDPSRRRRKHCPQSW